MNLQVATKQQYAEFKHGWNVCISDLSVENW